MDTHELFLDYRHDSSEASDVTFNLKDFKAMLVLCEGLGANVTICFDQPGAPLLVQPLFHSNNPLVRVHHSKLICVQPWASQDAACTYMLRLRPILDAATHLDGKLDGMMSSRFACFDRRSM